MSDRFIVFGKVFVIPVVKICPSERPMSLIIIVIETYGFVGHFECFANRVLWRFRPLEVVIACMGPGYAGVGAGIVGVPS